MKLKPLTRRLAAVFSIGALAATALAGCSSDGSSSGDGKSLSVWTWTTAGGLLKPAAAAFEKANPGTKIDIVDVGNPAIWDKITTGLAAGGQGLPDIMNTAIDQLPGYTDKFPNGFADMGPMGAKDLAGDFVPSAWGGGLGKDGQVWGIPFEVNTAGFAYRKDLLDAAGIDMASIKTWDELIDAGVTLKAKTGASLFELNKAAANTNAADFWQTLTQQQNAFYFNKDGDITMNGPEGVKSLTLLKKMNDKGVLADSASFTSGNGLRFADGSVAISPSASWWPGYIEAKQPQLKGKMATALRPVVEAGGSTAALAGSTYLSIAGNSANKDLAWKFVHFALGTLDGQQAMQTAQPFTPGFVPMYKTPGFTDNSGYWVGDSPSKVFVDSITQPDLAVSNYTSDYARAIRIYTDAQTKVMLSGADPKAALDEAAKLLAAQTGRKIAS